MKSKKIISVCTIVALMLSSSPITFKVSAAPIVPENPTRLWSEDMYETSVKISQTGWTNGSDYAVIVGGEGYADALCAAPLAKANNAPILLTEKNNLNEKTLNELKRLHVKHIYIIGGEGSVSEDVENALKNQITSDIQRIGGKNRYETSIKVAEKLAPSSSIFLASGEDFADALSVSPIASIKGIPIILTERDELPESTAKYVNNSKLTKTYIIGGTASVSDAVKNSVPSPQRLSGSDRYETNITVLNNFAEDFDFHNAYVTPAGGIKGGWITDTLAGAALAAKNSAPIILTNGTLSKDTETFVKSNLSPSSTITILGGADAIPDSAIAGFKITAQLLNENNKIYDAPMDSNVDITADNVVLKGNVKGDLYLEGNNDSVSNITVDGTIYINPGEKGICNLEKVKAKKIVVISGAKDSIHLNDVIADMLNIQSRNNARIQSEGSTSIGTTTVLSQAILEATSGSFGNVEVINTSREVPIEFRGTFNRPVTVVGVANINTTLGSRIYNIIVPPSEQRQDIAITGFGTIGNVYNQGQASNLNIGRNISILGTIETSVIGSITSSNSSIINRIQQRPTDQMAPLFNNLPSISGGGGGSVSTINLVDVSLNVSAGKILNTSTDMEYSLDNGTTWINCSNVYTATTFSNGNHVLIRNKQNIYNNKDLGTLFSASAPTVNLDFDTSHEAQFVESGNKVTAAAGYEYSLDGTTWNAIVDDTTVDASGDISVYVRKTATIGALASQATIDLDNTPSVDLQPVSLNVVDGKILSTTTSMEYSLDNGTTWSTCTDPETSVTFAEGNHILVRDKGNKSNINDLGSLNAAAAPNVTLAYNNDQSVAWFMEEGHSVLRSEGYEYSLDGRTWNPILDNTTIDAAGDKTVYVRKAVTAAALASQMTADLDGVLINEPDMYESDNSYRQANLISTDGTPQTHTIYPNNDVDWVKFEAEDGFIYTIQTSNLEPSEYAYPAIQINRQNRMDTVISLYSADGKTEIPLAENDDAEYYSGSSVITKDKLSKGTYYVKIVHYDYSIGYNDPNSIGKYDISVSKVSISETMNNARNAAEAALSELPDVDQITPTMGFGSFDKIAMAIYALNDAQDAGWLDSQLVQFANYDKLQAIKNKIGEFSQRLSAAIEVEMAFGGIPAADKITPDNQTYVQTKIAETEQAIQFAVQVGWSIDEISSSDNFNRLQGAKNKIAELVGFENLSLNIADGKITNTTITMEYSLNNGTSWNDCSDTNTYVKFANGNHVLVRIKSDKSNVKDLGTLTAASAPGVTLYYNDESAAQFMEGENRVTAAEGYEYSFDGRHWTTIDDYTTVDVSGDTTVYVRKAATIDQLPSQSTTDLDTAMINEIDSFESDNQRENANLISTDGTPQIHTIYPDGDVDWVKFEVKNGFVYTIKTTDLLPGKYIGNAEDMDTVISLYNDSGQRIGENDDGGEGLASKIVRKNLTEGTYYVKIVHFSRYYSGSIGKYNITVSKETKEIYNNRLADAENKLSDYEAKVLAASSGLTAELVATAEQTRADLFSTVDFSSFASHDANAFYDRIHVADNMLYDAREALGQMSKTPLINDITITNTAGETDTVTVSDLFEGDVVKVYASQDAETPIAESDPAGSMVITIDNLDLGADAGSLWISVTSPYKSESSRVEKTFDAEPVTTPLVNPSAIQPAALVQQIENPIQSSAQQETAAPTSSQAQEMTNAPTDTQTTSTQPTTDNQSSTPAATPSDTQEPAPSVTPSDTQATSTQTPTDNQASTPAPTSSDNQSTSVDTATDTQVSTSSATSSDAQATSTQTPTDSQAATPAVTSTDSQSSVSSQTQSQQ